MWLTNILLNSFLEKATFVAQTFSTMTSTFSDPALFSQIKLLDEQQLAELRLFVNYLFFRQGQSGPKPEKNKKKQRPSNSAATTPEPAPVFTEEQARKLLAECEEIRNQPPVTPPLADLEHFPTPPGGLPPFNREECYEDRI